MKKILLLLLIGGTVLNAQKVSEKESITYSEMKELLHTTKYKNRVHLRKYQTKSGNWISVGDTLEIGKPSIQNNLSAGQGTSNHNFIVLGTAASGLTRTFMMGDENMAGDKVFVGKIEMVRLSKKNDYEVVAHLNRLEGDRFLSVSKLARANIDMALDHKELIAFNNTPMMNRNQAIAKLKEAKDFLDLGLTSKVEYDVIKKELRPIIMNE